MKEQMEMWARDLHGPRGQCLRTPPHDLVQQKQMFEKKARVRLGQALGFGFYCVDAVILADARLLHNSLIRLTVSLTTLPNSL